MRTVRDEAGKQYLLLKESSDASLVRDPETGQERHLLNDRLEPAGGESALETAANAVPEQTRALLRAVRDDRSLGLLLEIDRRGPVAVRDLMGGYDLCESDLHGLLTEFRAARLLAEADVGGERGYDTTERAAAALGRLREQQAAGPESDE